MTHKDTQLLRSDEGVGVFFNIVANKTPNDNIMLVTLHTLDRTLYHQVLDAFFEAEKAYVKNWKEACPHVMKPSRTKGLYSIRAAFQGQDTADAAFNFMISCGVAEEQAETAINAYWDATPLALTPFPEPA